MINKHFTPLEAGKVSGLIPKELNNPFELNIPEIAKFAAKELQDYIIDNQQNWIHNFGIDISKTGYIKGKMFGVLVVENQEKEIGYLSAFSGKLDGNTFKTLFVPSLFDTSVEDYFLDKGMTELTELGNKIEQLKSEENSIKEIDRLKKKRKNKSTTLQQKIFDQYQFMNKGEELKSLCDIFEEYSDRKPAAGAGECSAPKLLHYAFKHKMKPLAIAEFWWGTTTKSNRRHLEFYPACNDKCRPILGYMLNS